MKGPAATKEEAEEKETLTEAARELDTVKGHEAGMKVDADEAKAKSQNRCVATKHRCRNVSPSRNLEKGAGRRGDRLPG